MFDVNSQEFMFISLPMVKTCPHRDWDTAKKAFLRSVFSLLRDPFTPFHGSAMIPDPEEGTAGHT